MVVTKKMFEIKLALGNYALTLTNYVPYTISINQ